MKKFLIVIAFIFLSIFSKVQAQTIKVAALEDFTTATPTATFKIKTLEPKQISNSLYLPEDTVISGIVIRVYEPQRGKRTSSFEFLPTSMICNDKDIEINNSKLFAKIVEYKPIDKKDMAIKVGVNVANFLLKGIIDAAEFVQGVAQNKYDGRIKSGILNVYSNSFLTYIEVGHELNINKGDTILLKIKQEH